MRSTSDFLVFVVLCLVCTSVAASLQPLRVDAGSDDNPLWIWFQKHSTGPFINKWTNYFDVYHRYFQRFRNKPVKFLEVGVQSGGSMEMWKSYFSHPDSRFYGVDINPYTKELFEDPPRVNIFVGSQSNRTFLRELFQKLPELDIVLDDGGHQMLQQIITIEELYNKVQPYGLYLVEDCATSYWKDYGGGLMHLHDIVTFMQYAKVLVDKLHTHWFTSPKYANHYSETELAPGRKKVYNMGPANFNETTVGISFFDQMVIFEKGRHKEYPTVLGHGSFKMEIYPPLTPEGQPIPSKLAEYREHLAKSRQ